MTTQSRKDISELNAFFANADVDFKKIVLSMCEDGTVVYSPFRSHKEMQYTPFALIQNGQSTNPVDSIHSFTIPNCASKILAAVAAYKEMKSSFTDIESSITHSKKYNKYTASIYCSLPATGSRYEIARSGDTPMQAVIELAKMTVK